MFGQSGNKFNATVFVASVSSRISFVLKAVLLTGAIAMIWFGLYQSAVETLLILAITMLPVVLGKRFMVRIPHGFEALTVVFVFMSLFLGEVQSYYTRFWWWDLVLHSGSAFIMGILGFLLVYVLNEKKEIEMHLNRNFVALFAFMFAIGIGTLWEIFEFFMDQVFGLNMQKSGLVDTMWDMIVNTFGALIISILGWGYIKTREADSFLERWIEEFIEKNPQLFEKQESES